MRPKSMATVVVVLSPVCVRSSMPAEADVITASVRSGLISETAPTNVVLPTPKPPATTLVAARLVDGDESGLGQVGDEDSGDAEGNGEKSRDLRDRLDLEAQPADPLVLGQLPLQPGRIGRRTDQRLDGELVARPGPAAGHRVRTHERVVPARTARGGRSARGARRARRRGRGVGLREGLCRALSAGGGGKVEPVVRGVAQRRLVRVITVVRARARWCSHVSSSDCLAVHVPWSRATAPYGAVARNALSVC